MVKASPVHTKIKTNQVELHHKWFQRVSTNIFFQLSEAVNSIQKLNFGKERS